MGQEGLDVANATMIERGEEEQWQPAEPGRTKEPEKSRQENAFQAQDKVV